MSVGTFNEALRIAQSRGVVLVRPGPGGGVFAAAQSPMVRLGNSVLALDGDQTSVAEAIRIRDALDPLLIEDALWHASPADIAEMREILAEMAAAADRLDGIGFVHANWSLHARIAAVSPQPDAPLALPEPARADRVPHAGRAALRDRPGARVRRRRGTRCTPRSSTRSRTATGPAP